MARSADAEAAAVSAFLGLPTSRLTESGTCSSDLHVEIRLLNGLGTLDEPARACVALNLESGFIVATVPIQGAMVVPTGEWDVDVASVLSGIVLAVCNGFLHPVGPTVGSVRPATARPTRVTTTDFKLAAYLRSTLGKDGGTAVAQVDDSKVMVAPTRPGSLPFPLNAIMDSCFTDMNARLLNVVALKPPPANTDSHLKWKEHETKGGTYVSLVEESYGGPIPAQLFFCALPSCAVLTSSQYLNKCAKCRVVRYCDSKCQKADWRQHKPSCVKLPKPADSGGGGGGSSCAAGGDGATTETNTGKKKKKKKKKKKHGAAAASSATGGAVAAAAADDRAGDFNVGDAVEIDGSEDTLLNGMRGTIAAPSGTARGWPVELHSGRVVTVTLPSHLRRVVVANDVEICPFCTEPIPCEPWREGGHRPKRLTYERFPCCGAGCCSECLEQFLEFTVRASGADMGSVPQYSSGAEAEVAYAAAAQLPAVDGGGIHNTRADVVGKCPLCRTQQPELSIAYEAQKMKMFQARIKKGIRADDALYRLGSMAESRGDLEKALKYYVRGADTGPTHNALAERDLGFLFLTGRGVTADPVKAFAYFERAANRGFAQAQYDLGCSFYFGNARGPPNIPMAIRMYRLAAAQGDIHARFNLGLIFFDAKYSAAEHREAAEMLRANVDEGNGNRAECAHNLGNLYSSPLTPSVQDFEEAAKMYEIAYNEPWAVGEASPIEREVVDLSSDSMLRRAMLVLGGKVAGKNEQAIQLVQRAAEAGCPQAQGLLAHLTSEFGVVPGPFPTTIEAGCRVRINGLQSKPKLNGMVGIVEAKVGAKERWGVRVAADLFSLKAANLSIIP